MIPRTAEIEMMKDTESWPLYPYLALRRFNERDKGERPVVGVLSFKLVQFPELHYEWTVHETNIFKPNWDSLKTTFKTIEEVYDAGWRGN